MDCVTFMKHSIMATEFGPGLSKSLGVFLLMGFGVKFLCSDRFIIKPLIRQLFPKGVFRRWRRKSSDDVARLRESIEAERRRASALEEELAMERYAAASAAEEAMSMILRLQREKSSIELESRQYRRMAEEKQKHDHDVIRHLRRRVRKYE